MSLLRLTKINHVDLALAEYIFCKLHLLHLRLKSKLHFTPKFLSFPTIYNTFKINIKVHGY